MRSYVLRQLEAKRQEACNLRSDGSAKTGKGKKRLSCEEAAAVGEWR